MLVSRSGDCAKLAEPEEKLTMKRTNENSTDAIEGSPRRVKPSSSDGTLTDVRREASRRVRSGPLWHSDDDSDGDDHGTPNQLGLRVKGECRPGGNSQSRTRELGQNKLAQTLNERRKLSDREAEKGIPVAGERPQGYGSISLPRQDAVIIDPDPGESEPITETPGRADGLGIISYYPHFPGCKTSNRDLFSAKKIDKTNLSAIPASQTMNASATRSEANGISATGWQIASGIIPEECFTPVNRRTETIERTENPLFVGQDEGKERELIQVQQTVTAKERVGKAKRDSTGKRKEGEQLKMGISDESRAQWQDKLKREAVRSEESRRQQEHWKRERQNKQRGQESRVQKEISRSARNERETGGHPEGIGQLSRGRTVPDTTNVAEQAWQFGISTVAPEHDSQAFAEARPSQRTERHSQWKRAETALEENSKKSVDMASVCRLETSLHKDCNSRPREAIREHPGNFLRGKIDVPGDRFLGQHRSLLDQRYKPSKSVRFEGVTQISEYDADKSINDVKQNMLQCPLGVLQRPSIPRLSNVCGGKDLELVERLYQERQKDNDNNEPSRAEAEPPKLTALRNESPVRTADYTYWTYSVQRKEWDSSQDEEDMDWVQYGDIYTSSHHADRAAGKEILQQRGAPQPMFPDADEWSMSKDGAGLKVYLLVANGYNVRVRVSRILRTGKDGIPPISRIGWLKRVVYEVKYETGEEPAEDEDNTKVIPELFTIRGQANQEAASKLIDLSVNPESQKIDEVQRLISLRRQVDDFLATVEQEEGLFEAEGEDGTGVKVWVEERALSGPRNI